MTSQRISTHRKAAGKRAAASQSDRGPGLEPVLSHESSVDESMENMPSLSFSGSTHRLSSPWLPTTPEILLLLAYPTILVAGSVFGALSMPARLAPYSPVRQSFYPAHLAPSYFALKSNVFNVFFVKIGWFWVSAAFFVYWALHSSLGRPLNPTTRRRIQAAVRWAAVTGWWFIVTQWFVGPSLIDRGFTFTGGKCEAKIEQAETEGIDADFGTLATAIACKAAGGRWAGGHDISGHVFLLTLGSAFLALEILPGVLRGRGMRDKRAIVLSDRSVKSAASQLTVGASEGNWAWGTGVGYVLGFAIAVITLSWWMLLMTATYFHTWFEKTTGLITALVGLWVVFFLPRVSPLVRSAVGMPGV